MKLFLRFRSVIAGFSDALAREFDQLLEHINVWAKAEHHTDGTHATVTADSVTVTGDTFGYATGAGGAVTQATSKSTGVTLNTACGVITMNNAALAAGAEVAFTLTNSTIAATDVPVVAIASGGTSAAYVTSVTAVAAGSCDITLGNVSAGGLSEAVVLNFVVIKGVSS